jgi:hypothetical protein
MQHQILFSNNALNNSNSNSSNSNNSTNNNSRFGGESAWKTVAPAVVIVVDVF